MNQPRSALADTPSVDAVLDQFLERLDDVQNEAGIAALVEEYSASYPARVVEFRRLAQGWRELRDLRDPERLGPYRIRGVIALGGMGKIYEAEEDDLKRIVAVKTIKPGPAVDKQLLARFDRERKALARLHHTHVVPIFATGQQDGLLYFAMPRLHGASLRSLIRTADGKASNGTSYLPFASFEALVTEASKAEASDHISQVAGHAQTNQHAVGGHPASAEMRQAETPEYREKAVRLMIEVAEAVHHAHLASVIHRDLKPSNIVVEHSSVENSYHSWVLDFGLAMFKTDSAEPAVPDPAGIRSTTAEQLTQGLLGTPIYMAPEQIEPSPDRPIDARTDVYALGATLYELLTLRPAVDVEESITHPRERLDSIRHLILHESPKLPGRLILGFPRELQAVCLKALKKQPEDRYASARELAYDLRRWLEGKPTRAGKAGPITRLAMLIKRRRATSAAVAAIALLVAGAATSVVYISRVIANHAIAQAKVNKAEAAHLNAQLVLTKERELALQREKDFVALQRMRTASHPIGWFDEVWTKVRSLRGAVSDPRLQAQAAASLEGIDARFRKSFPRAVQQVALDPKGDRLLMHADGPETNGHPTSVTLLWDGATDTMVVEKDLGSGVVTFRDDGTPIQLSHNGDGAAVLTLYDVSTSRPLHQFRSARAGSSANTASALSRSGRHVAAVTRSVRIEPDGRTIPVGDATTLAVWDATSGDQVRTVEHKKTVGLVLSPDGRLLAAWDEASEVTVWLLPTGKPLAHFRVSRAPVKCLAFGRDPVWHDTPGLQLPPWLLAAGDSGGLITVWDLSANRQRSICRGSLYEVNALDFSPDGAFIASAGRHHVRLWDVATGRNLLIIPKATSYQVLHSITFAPDGQSLVIANGPEFLNRPSADIVVLEYGRGIRTLYGLQGAVESITVSPDGRLIAAVSHDWQVGIWNRLTGELLAVLEVPVGYSVDNAAIAFDADGRRFACSAGHEARLWDLNAHRLIRSWELPVGLDGGLAFQGADRLMLARTETRSGRNPPARNIDPSQDPRVIRLYDLLGAMPVKAFKEITEFDQHVDQVTVAPNSSYCLVQGVGTVNGRPRQLVSVFDGQRGELLGAIDTRRPLHFFSGAVFDPAGEVLGLSLEPSGSVTLLELPSLRTRTVTEPEPDFRCLGPGGSRRGVIHYLWPDQPALAILDQSQPEQAVVRILLEAGPVRFTPDGQTVVWCNRDGTLSVCDLKAANRRLTELGMGW
jgi:serine/threonine protein kinase/WD40 repeat protein